MNMEQVSNDRKGKGGTGLIIIGGLLMLGIVVAGYLVMDNGDSSAAGDSELMADGGLLPAGYGTVPSNAMFTERDGSSMALGDLQGKVWVASFIFTRCRGTCPAMTASLGELQEDLRDLGDVALVSFTVDPEYDTPERLNEYAEEYDADKDRWLFLQGSDSSIQELARNTFHVGIAEGVSEEEPIIHSSRFFLVDAQGEIRGVYDGRSREGKEKLIDDIRMLLENGGESRGT